MHRTASQKSCRAIDPKECVQDVHDLNGHASLRTIAIMAMFIGGEEREFAARVQGMPRELIEPHKGDKRYVRRKKGKFTKSQVDVGRSLAADRRTNQDCFAVFRLRTGMRSPAQRPRFKLGK
jgi:hypothetical protein